MTGTLALVGGEPFAGSCTFNRRLVEAAGATGVVVLTTAAAFENPDRWVKGATAAFAPFGVTVTSPAVHTRADAMDDAKAQVVRTARVIYLVGPSAQHARPTLQQTPVWEALVAAYQEGATVIASDGGAEVVCDPMVDDRGGAFTVGLGLVQRLAVVSRANTWSTDALHRVRELSGPDLAVVCVDESTAAIRTPDGHWTAEGAGRVDVHVGAEAVDLADLQR